MDLDDIHDIVRDEAKASDEFRDEVREHITDIRVRLALLEERNRTLASSVRIAAWVIATGISLVQIGISWLNGN